MIIGPLEASFSGKLTEGPRLTRILRLGKTVLHEIRVSGTVGGPLPA